MRIRGDFSVAIRTINFFLLNQLVIKKHLFCAVASDDSVNVRIRVGKLLVGFALSLHWGW